MCIRSTKLKNLYATRLEGKEFFYKGDLSLLEKKCIAIVGSRKPNAYARSYTHTVAQKLSQAGVCIVSGGAIGTDAIAHKAAGASHTIMVAATGLDKRYPAINKKLIQEIETKGLVLSQFEEGTPSQRYNFPLRNELIVALSEAVVVTYADRNSGSVRSIEYALKMGKPIYVLPHRIGESDATNDLLRDEKAQAIYDVDEFVSLFGNISRKEDPFLSYCMSHPTYEEALQRYPERVFEAELAGEIEIKNARIYLL